MSLSPSDIAAIAERLISSGNSVRIAADGSISVDSSASKAGNAERCRRYRMSKHVESMSNHVKPCQTMSAKQVDLFGESEPLKPHKRITWTPEAGWQGITDEDRKQFTAAAPAVDIERALSAADLWLRSNPAKQKKNHYRFFVNWITSKQERGGDKPSNQTTNGNDRTTHRPPVTRNAAPLSSNQPSLDESGNRGCEVSGVPSAWGPRVGDDGEIEW